MQDFMTFTARHSLLSIAIIIIFVILIIIELIRSKRSTYQISALHATQMINHENAVVIDIRPNDVYRKGHIIDAYCLSAEELKQNPKKLEKFRSKPIIFVCNTGIESQKLAATLIKQGYNVYALAGGIRAWSEAQMPLVKETKNG